MIKTIKLNNFQRHEDSVFDFKPGINVICGKTNSGKSSVIRAIKYVAENRPSSNNFERRGAKGFEIEIEFDNGTVKRIKGKGNKYFLNDKELNAVGTDVPEEISELLGFNEFTLQGQFDSVKFLNDSPGKVAKYINAITKQEIIDDITKLANAEVSNINTEKNRIEKNLEDAEKQLDSLQPLVDLKGKVDRIDSRLKDYDSLVAKKEKMVSLIIEIERANKLISKYQHVVLLLQKVHKASTALNEVLELDNKIKKLLTLKGNIQNNERILKALEIDSVVQKQKQIEEEEKALNKTNELIRKINLLTRSLLSNERSLEEKSKTLTAKQNELSEIDICPLCGNKWERA